MLEKGFSKCGWFLNLSIMNYFLAHLPTFMRTDDATDNRFKPAKIVGGQIAPSPIPWQVSLQEVGGSHFCGGTILDTFTILSAAHCFSGRDLMNGYFIRAGSQKRSSGGQVC